MKKSIPNVACVLCTVLSNQAFAIEVLPEPKSPIKQHFILFCVIIHNETLSLFTNNIYIPDNQVFQARAAASNTDTSRTIIRVQYSQYRGVNSVDTVRREIAYDLSGLFES